MKNLELIVKELQRLTDEGVELVGEGQSPDMALGRFGPRYEQWYTKARAVVTQIIPERLPEFTDAYRLERRKEILYDTYAISDFLLGVRITRGGTPVFDVTQAFAGKILRQIGIVAAAANTAPSILRDIRTTLRAELLDSDILAASALLKSGHLRSAGVICGVVLETHLKSLCERHAIKIGKKNPGIGDFNDLLKNASIYDTPTWRLIQRLADIRNLCGHRKERDPKTDEIEDMVSGTDKIIKEIG